MPGGLPLQRKGQALGLADNGVAGWGIATELSFDVGSLDMRGDAAVAAFDKPVNPTDHWSMTIILRSLADSMANGVQGVSVSWDYFGDGHSTMTPATWANGVFTLLTPTVTGVSTPSVSGGFSAQVTGTNPATLTAFLGGVAKGSWTDPSIPSTGTVGSAHFFRSTPTSNVFMDGIAFYKVNAPVIPPPSGAVDATLSPFPPSDPAKMPRGDACVFDSLDRPVVPANANANTIGFGTSILNATNTPNVHQVDNFENHECTIQSDKRTVFGHQILTMTAGDHTVCDIVSGQSWHCVSPTSGQAERATGLSGMAFCLRNWELQLAAGGDINAIKHAVGLGISSHVLNHTFAWPATSTDSFAGTNTGFMPAGGFMAIATSKAMPAGLNNVQKALWTALRNYGAYQVDATGSVSDSTPTLTVLECEAAADGIVTANLRNSAASSQVNAGTLSILQQLRWVTNASQTNVGGPGNRLAPLGLPF